MQINFYGPEWGAMKQWLLESKQRKIDLLIRSDQTHDMSNQLRGALSMINEILALEKAAQQSR